MTGRELTTSQRGYGKTHTAERKRWRAIVEAGDATCSRCLAPIAPPGEPCPGCGREVAAGRPGDGRCGWDVGHDDLDRTFYTGPEHSCCNRRAGGRRGATTSARRRRVRAWSRQWLED